MCALRNSKSKRFYCFGFSHTSESSLKRWCSAGDGHSRRRLSAPAGEKFPEDKGRRGIKEKRAREIKKDRLQCQEAEKSSAWGTSRARGARDHWSSWFRGKKRVTFSTGTKKVLRILFSDDVTPSHGVAHRDLLLIYIKSSQFDDCVWWSRNPG